jgi:hypothetical protein
VPGLELRPSIPAALITIFWGRNLVDIAAILLTCTVLIILLGLNVSVLGLVYLPGSAISLVAKMFGLILLLNLVYLATFLLLERKKGWGKNNVCLSLFLILRR